MSAASRYREGMRKVNGTTVDLRDRVSNEIHSPILGKMCTVTISLGHKLLLQRENPTASQSNQSSIVEIFTEGPEFVVC